MYQHYFAKFNEDVTGSQSRLCDRTPESGSRSLSCDIATKAAPNAPSGSLRALAESLTEVIVVDNMREQCQLGRSTYTLIRRTLMGVRALIN